MKRLLLAIAVCFSASLQVQEISITDKSKLVEKAMQFKMAGKAE